MGGLAVWGNYVWCLAIATQFKGLGGANRWGGGSFKVILGMASHKEDEDWSNSWLLLIFIFINSRHIAVQGICKFQVSNFRNIFMVLGYY